MDPRQLCLTAPARIHGRKSTTQPPAFPPDVPRLFWVHPPSIPHGSPAHRRPGITRLHNRTHHRHLPNDRLRKSTLLQQLVPKPLRRLPESLPATPHAVSTFFNSTFRFRISNPPSRIDFRLIRKKIHPFIFPR